MSKLSLDALKERAGAVASVDLLNSISGGTENSCHDSGLSSPTPPPPQLVGGPVRHPLNQQYQDNGGRNPLSPLGQWLADWLWN